MPLPYINQYTFAYFQRRAFIRDRILKIKSILLKIKKIK